jgi:hypothetical protein
MSQGQTDSDVYSELINAKNIDFVKPKLFIKNIGHIATTSNCIHVRVLHNYSQIFDTQNMITAIYDQLLAKHEESFQSIAKSTTDVSLMKIASSLEDFTDIIKVLPQSTPNRPKQIQHPKNFNHCHGNGFFQYISNHTIGFKFHCPEIKNRPSC